MAAKTRTTRSSSAEFWFDKQAADLACHFFPRYLRHVKGERAGEPLELQPWAYRELIRPLFGWKRADGSRRYRKALAAIPRKNAKSTICAGIGIKLLFSDFEPGAEVYSAAADTDQANIVFGAAKQMVERAPALAKRCKIYRKAIVVEATASVYRVLSADAYTKHGLNAHGIIFDELHTQPNRELWDVLNTSTGSRRQPLSIAITTAGYDRQSICHEVWDYARRVRDGIVHDNEFLAVIYEALQTDDWRKVATWRKANPGYGVTIRADYLKAEAKKAEQIPAYQNTFRRLHLNQWTEQDTRWLDMESWDECAGVLDEQRLAGLACFGGLDLASTIDIAALALTFELDGKVHALLRFWIPQDNIRKRVERDGVPYDLWVRQGLMKATPGNIIDYDVIRADINALGERFNIREIAIDRWNATQLATQLQGDGFTVALFGQGFASMGAPTKDLEKRIVGRELVHGGNPVLRWMAANVAVKQDPAGNLKPAKDKSVEKIDGVVALIMALGRLMVAKPEQQVGAEVW